LVAQKIRLRVNLKGSRNRSVRGNKFADPDVGFPVWFSTKSASPIRSVAISSKQAFLSSVSPNDLIALFHRPVRYQSRRSPEREGSLNQPMFAPVLSINTPGAIRAKQEDGNTVVRQNHEQQITELMKTIKTRLLTGTAAWAAINWVACLQAQSFLLGQYDAPHYSGSDHSDLSSSTGKVYLGFDGGAAFQQPINLYDSIGDNEKGHVWHRRPAGL
jgi:hypothetical protein